MTILSIRNIKGLSFFLSEGISQYIQGSTRARPEYAAKCTEWNNFLFAQSSWSISPNSWQVFIPYKRPGRSWKISDHVRSAISDLVEDYGNKSTLRDRL